MTITSDFVWQAIQPRPRDAHKGTFGSVLAVAGSASYRGAAALAVEGALRTGAGIVTLASVEPVLAAVAARLPECCLCPCEAGAEGGISPQNIDRIRRQKASVLLAGPGLGYTAQSAARAAETRALVKTLLPGFSGSAVLDADGLNLQAAHPQWYQYLGEHVVLTPHIGEMSRLSGRTIQEIQHEIADTALKCAAETGSVCVLKDACTVIADEKGQMYLNISGNSGMATAGSGDVLSGILAAVLCMYLKTEEQPPMVLKAALGVYLHGLCGDLAAAEKGKRSMLAGDIIEYLPKALAIGEEESEL